MGCSPWGRKESDTTSLFTFHFHALEKEMATHSSVLAWIFMSALGLLTVVVLLAVEHRF